MKKFSLDKRAKLLMDVVKDEAFVSLGLVEILIIDRLFAMHDSDQDGVIGAKEFAIWIRRRM